MFHNMQRPTWTPLLIIRDTPRLLFPLMNIVLCITSNAIGQPLWDANTVVGTIQGAWTRVGDIDSDGDPDLFIQDGHYVLWYENQQPGWVEHLVDDQFYNSGYSWTEEYDLDGDGDIDFVQIPLFNPGTVAWDENVNNGATWERHVITSTANLPAVMQGAFGDIDGDGDIDMVIPELGSGWVSWYENALDDTVWIRHPIDSIASMVWGTVADMDDDGDLDVVSGANSSGMIHWYQNDLPDTSWTSHFLGTMPGTLVGEGVDIDGDGDEDIVTHSSSLLAYFENPSGVRVTVSSGFSGLHLGRIGDIDRDGDNDITFGGDGFGTSGSIGWVEHLDATWERHDIDSSSLLARVPTGLADIDGDGDNDLTAFRFNVGTTIGDAIWYANPEITTGVSSQQTGTPSQFLLSQNFPNPFNPSTVIKYELPEATHVTLEILNLLGQREALLFDQVQAPGAHTVAVSADNLASGVYFYRLVTDHYTESRKMILIK